MRLERFRLQGFAQHQDLDLVFRDGAPNLIIGPNEAGKSHLMRALLGTLYGIADPEPFIPWHGDPTMTGRLTFITGQDRIELERRFVDQQVAVWINGENEYSGRGWVSGRANEDDRYRSFLYTWIGFAEPDVFRRTVFVGQDLVHDERLGAFSAQIKRVISGTQEANYDTAINDLDAELDTLIKRPGKRNDRRRERLFNKLTDIETRHTEAARVQARVVELIAEEQPLEEKIEQARATEDRYNTIVEKYGEYQELEKQERDERQRWTDLERQIKNLESRRQQRTTLEKQRDELRIPGDLTPDQIREIGWRTEQAEGQIRQLENWLDQESGAPARQSAEQQHAGPSGARVAVVIAGVLVAVASIALGSLVDPAFSAGLVLAVGVLLYALFRMSPAATARSPETIAPPSKQLAELEDQLSTHQDELNTLQKRRDELLTATGLPTLDAVHERAGEYQRAVIALEQLAPVDEAELSDLNKRLEDAQQNTVIASRSRQALVEAHPEIQRIPAEELENYRQAVIRAKQEREQAEDRLRGIQFERQQLAQGADDAEALRQEIGSLKAEIEQVELLAEAHELAISTLQESVREFQENALDPVAENAARYFMGITDGRYDGVDLDRNSMTPTVSGNGRSDVAFDRLSRGAKDQLYLSIRAALIDALSGDRHLPMILDDPCVHFDDGRLEATAELIAEIARERQILLFTKDETWTRWFEPALRLERQDSGKTALRYFP